MKRIISFEAFGKKFKQWMKIKGNKLLDFNIIGEWIEVAVIKGNPKVIGGIASSLSFRFVKISDAKNLVLLEEKS